MHFTTKSIDFFFYMKTYVVMLVMKKKHRVKFCSDARSKTADHFWVNVSTVELLATPLRETGHVAIHPGCGCPRGTSRCQDRAILTTVGAHNTEL